MDFIALTLGIIFIIVSIFFLLFKKSEKYVERKAAIILFIFGIVWIILAFIANRELNYLIIGLTFIIIGIGILYLKKKNPENKKRTTIALVYIGFGILWVLRVFI